MTLRVIITGASGLLGRAIYELLTPMSGLTVLGLCNTRCSNQYYQKCDLTNPDSVSDCLNTFQPNLIIHCAAERRPDVIEKRPDLAESINIKATQTLADLAKRMNACLLFISTDYVMDGKSPPYFEDSSPNPLNSYGLSKLNGEKIVLGSCADNIVVRVPLLYGFVEFLSESAVTVLFSKVKDSSQRCNMSHYERRYPTHCNDVALFIAKIIEAKFLIPNKFCADIKGILHFSANEEMTKYDMSVVMADVFHLSKDHLIADTNASAGGATRPYNARLCSKINEELGLVVSTRSFKDAIEECLKSWL